MRLWRKPQPPAAQPEPADLAQPEPAPQQQPAVVVVDDRGLPGAAGYGVGGFRKQKGRNHMPASRFNYVRPDGKPD